MKLLLIGFTFLASVSSFASDCSSLEGTYSCEEISQNSRLIYVVGNKIEISSSQSLFEVKNIKEDQNDKVLYKVFPDGIKRDHDGYTGRNQVVNAANGGVIKTTCAKDKGVTSLKISVKNGIPLWWQDTTTVTFKQLNDNELLIEKTNKETGVMKDSCSGVHCSKASDEKGSVKCIRL